MTRPSKSVDHAIEVYLTYRDSLATTTETLFMLQRFIAETYRMNILEVKARIKERNKTLAY